ncbi:MAG: flagellar biosynthetic protein FliR [Syntrophales bacterium]
MRLPLFSLELTEGFIFVLIRVSSILMMVPVFGDSRIPASVKWGLSLLISLMLFPVVRAGFSEAGNFTNLLFISGIAGEMLIGVTIGFAARLVFAGIQIAGEILGFQMGFSFASVVDPLTNIQVTVISEFQYLLGMLLFMSVNAHHIFISAIADSYLLFPPLGVHFTGAFFQGLLILFREIFVIAIKISAPVMAVLLFSNIAMGMVARTVPQMNVFAINFPLQIGIGLMFIGLAAPVFVRMAAQIFLSLSGDISVLMRLMRI